jgi:tetratricopeptide (TPR) repeat protein
MVLNSWNKISYVIILIFYFSFKSVAQEVDSSLTQNNFWCTKANLSRAIDSLQIINGLSLNNLIQIQKGDSTFLNEKRWLKKEDFIETKEDLARKRWDFEYNGEIFNGFKKDTFTLIQFSGIGVNNRILYQTNSRNEFNHEKIIDEINRYKMNMVEHHESLNEIISSYLGNNYVIRISENLNSFSIPNKYTYELYQKEDFKLINNDLQKDSLMAHSWIDLFRNYSNDISWYRFIRDYDKAINSAKKILYISPNFTGFYKCFNPKINNIEDPNYSIYDLSFLNDKKEKKYNHEWFDKGLLYLNRSLETNPVNLSFLNLRSKIYAERYQYELAIQDCNKIIQIDSNYADAYKTLGDIYSSFVYYSFYEYQTKKNNNLQKSKTEIKIDAIKSYTKAIELGCNDLEDAYLLRCFLKSEIGDNVGSSLDFSKSTAISYNDMGKIKYELEDYQGALIDFSNALQLDQEGSYFYDRANAKVKVNDLRGALLDYDNAIKHDSKNYEFYINRGLLKLLIGKNKGACLDFSVAGENGLDEAYELIKKHCN